MPSWTSRATLAASILLGKRTFADDVLKIHDNIEAFAAQAAGSPAMPPAPRSVHVETATGSWTIPAGVTQIEIELWGGGGAGNYAGGGGAECRRGHLAVTPGQTLSFTIGGSATDSTVTYAGSVVFTAKAGSAGGATLGGAGGTAGSGGRGFDGERGADATYSGDGGMAGGGGGSGGRGYGGAAGSTAGRAGAVPGGGGGGAQTTGSVGSGGAGLLVIRY